MDGRMVKMWHPKLQVELLAFVAKSTFLRGEWVMESKADFVMPDGQKWKSKQMPFDDLIAGGWLEVKETEAK